MYMIVIIDGHSIAYKIFYKSPPLYNSRKIPTSTIHSFLNTVLTIKDKFNPQKMIVIFDSKGETFRHELFNDYKANRSKAPEDLIIQVEYLKKIIPLIGVDLYAKEGFEADDIIYTLSMQTEEPVLIVTKDKDLAQIVDNKVKILDYQTSEIIDRDKVFEKFGIYPEQITDLLALAGDSSDNIPGVKGIGEKTALSLLQQYGNLENIYNNLENIKNSIREKLEKNKTNAFLSKELAKLKFVENVEQARYQSTADLKEILQELELKTIYKRLFGEDKKFELSSGEISNPDVVVFINNKIYASDGKKYKSLEKIIFSI